MTTMNKKSTRCTIVLKSLKLYCILIPLYIINRIKQKIIEGNAILTQADKDKTIVIIYKQDYDQKIHSLLTENEIHSIPKNPINKDCKIIRDTLQKSNLIFTKEQIKYLTQKKPMPPRQCPNKNT
jgi:hypothetical protein